MKKLIFILSFLLMFANFGFADEVDVDSFMKKYNDEIQNSIKANFKYDGDENATASVSYKINSDGTITDIKVEQSGGEEMDKALIEAVEKSAPFKPFPQELNLSSIRITSGFKHTVHKYQSPSIGYQETRMAILPVEPPAEVQKLYKNYIGDLQKYIFNKIPTTYSYIPKEPVIKCTVTKNGTLKDVKLLQSSGLEEYDKKIIEVFSTTQYKPFPPELSQYSEEIPFQLRVYKQIRTNPSFGNPYYRIW